MEPIPLYPLDLVSEMDIGRLSDFLQPLLPYSLPILGSLFSEQPTKNTPLPTQFWTTFRIPDYPQPPSIFSVIAFSHLTDNQFRFFCSAESNLPPTPDEETHVFGAIQSFINAIQIRDPLIRGIDIDTIVHHVDDGQASIFFGSLHEKWIPGIQNLTTRPSPCVKFIRSPRPAAMTIPCCESIGDWEISEPGEQDIDIIRGRATFPRSREFVASRLPYSVCIRLKEGDGTPIAWHLLLQDGSLGMLHVEPEYRRKNLGKLCTEAIIAKLEDKFRPDEGRVEKYPWKRWEFLDVLAGNEKGLGFAASLDGWERGWVSYWVHLKLCPLQMR